MNHELAQDIRLFVKMLELFHGKYAYQGWAYVMRDWANRVDALESPDTVYVVEFEDDNERHISSIHATEELANLAAGTEGRVIAWMVWKDPMP